MDAPRQTCTPRGAAHGETKLRSFLAALLMIMGLMIAPGPALSQPTQRPEATMDVRSWPCAPEANVDTCWRAGVKAEKRGDAKAALAAYEASCAAGLQISGCYEAGKIYFLKPATFR